MAATLHPLDAAIPPADRAAEAGAWRAVRGAAGRRLIRAYYRGP